MPTGKLPNLDPSPSQAQRDYNALRMEALMILERCLSDENSAAFERFIEAQIAQEAPPVPLMREIAEDLHQRLQSCRQRLFDLRESILHDLKTLVRIDLNSLCAGQDPEYWLLHLLDECYPAVESHIPHAPVEIKLEVFDLMGRTQEAAAIAVRQQIMFEHLYDALMDWALALGIVSARTAWRAALSEHFVQNIWINRL
ncbi:MAG: hypothetical protein UZ15_CFX003000454 [Chloroflexi bacterium OLB15]|nr:MAG: hypothetical protein UZ15_CFX003000454 [Chloroflexi bacterium OLB15]